MLSLSSANLKGSILLANRTFSVGLTARILSTVRRPASLRPAATSAADEAARVDFHGRFREWEVTGPQTRLDRRPEEFPHKIFDRALEIAEGDIGIDG